MSFDKFGIDVLKVINGSSTKPFAFMPHFPGTGVGGHCIPVDPYYIIAKAADLGFDHEFLKTARRINNFMPQYTVRILEKLVEESGRNLNGRVVGLMGIAVKKGINDTRNSPYTMIENQLQQKDIEVFSFDPKAKFLSSTASLEELLLKRRFYCSDY